MASENCSERRKKTMKRLRSSRIFTIPPVSNLVLAILLVTWSDLCVQDQHYANGFICPLSPRNEGRFILYRSRTNIAASADRNKLDDDDNRFQDASWSRSAVKRRRSASESQRSGSRLQVRRRVKAVLEKARIRTGLKNGSVPPPQPPPRSTPTIVAEAATIGGLGAGLADMVFTQIDQQSPLPDEELGLVNVNNGMEQNGAVQQKQQNETLRNGEFSEKLPVSASRKPKEFDVIRGDVPSAAAFIEPLPFKLPKLTIEQKSKLVNGERVQEQSRMGREGSGYVVLDIEAPPYIIWECLLNFESYPEQIPTVRGMQLYTSKKLDTGFVNEKPVMPGTGRETRLYGTPSITRASFILSKFRLNIAVIHKYTLHPKGDYMEFTLDPSCTNVVLKGAKGTWYTEENPDERKGFTRVYLLASLQVSRALPKFIVDYAAQRAMPRATNWLKPEAEALKEVWLNNDDQ